MERLNEELLTAWLRLSTSIVNSRIVSELTYNETLVCNILYRSGDEPLTATELCRKTKMLKSQMNRTLNLLEKKGMITRQRSKLDKRSILVFFNIEKAEIYEKQHKAILKILDGIIENLGEEKTLQTVNNITEIANIADNLLKNEEKL